MFHITQFWLFCCLQLSVVFADDIDIDYYFGSSYEALRARDTLDCKNPVNVLFCKYKCKNDAGVCFENKCYCVYEPKTDLDKKADIITHVKYPEKDVILKYSPGRRHHIAHFCPNLDEARKCIRKCMKEGKPAFCGKDHICYCGHRYSQHQKEEKLDPAKINAGFYDLYLKYFGPDTTVMKQSTEEKENKKRDPPTKIIENHSESIQSEENNKQSGDEKIANDDTETEESQNDNNKETENKEEDGNNGSNQVNNGSAQATEGNDGETETKNDEAAEGEENPGDKEAPQEQQTPEENDKVDEPDVERRYLRRF